MSVMKKKKIVLFLLLLAFPFPVTAAPVAVRTEELAALYLDKPYRSDPLGEGKNGIYDKDPLIREDAFDCVTYVELILALKATDGEKGKDLQDILNLIRYQGGTIDFFKRNHFMEEHWIKNALKYDIIRAYPQTVGTENAVLKVDFPQWYKERIEQKKALDAKDMRRIKGEKPFETTSPYVPASELTEDFLKKQPVKAVVFLIKCDLDEGPIKGDMITHMGLLFHGRDLYHASKEMGKVVKVDFKRYMEEHSSFCGLMLYEVVK